MFENKKDFESHFERRLLEKFGREVADSSLYERYAVLGEMVRDHENINWRIGHEIVAAQSNKELIYFSMEFLMGRLLVNNMMNLGIYSTAKEGLCELGIDINELEEVESDSGLGNGGLGRLAACFLDSIASLGYPGHGHSIRYQYGFFKQKFVNGKQIELPDQWLANGNVWEVQKPHEQQRIQFYGYVVSEFDQQGREHFKTINSVDVTAMPYDIAIPGYRNGVINSLRLWSSEPVADFIPSEVLPFEKYLNSLEQISHSLYPDDSTEDGRLLRVRQQYFFVSAGIQYIIHKYMRKHKSIKNFHKHYVFQLNDTHPILAIPEMMRVLIDEYYFEWNDAWEQVQKVFAYTNHTVLPEALEKWPIDYIKKLLPRIYMILQEINRRFDDEMTKRGTPEEARNNMGIIRNGNVRMANLAIYTCFSVNGVAQIHSDILKAMTFRDFYTIYPHKFNNKTNGVTHRRWLLSSNYLLKRLIDDRIGEEGKFDADKLTKLMSFVEDKKTQTDFLKVKLEAKKNLKKYLKAQMNIEIDENSMLDVQIKRLHAYKRQTLNIFHIIYLYQRMKTDKSFRIEPRTFIFGAKAAPSYIYAKRIIELIIAVGNTINSDPDVSRMLKVVFVENYGVTWAEKIVPATDVHEQISLAGKEASGTSNMKFMMNGAITLGTLDGANVEINQLVGDENSVIFGMSETEVQEQYCQRKYDPRDYYNHDARLKNVLDSLCDGTWAPESDPTRFKLIFDEIVNRGDEYFVLKDFDSYTKAQERSETLYKDRKNWAKMCLINIAQSGYFSSDRTIKQYVDDIWHLQKIRFLD